MMLNLDNVPKRGENVTFVLRGARFNMRIEEARIRYGDIDVRITPLSGEGSFWVRYSSIKKNTVSEGLKELENGTYTNAIEEVEDAEIVESSLVG